jgi:N-acyl-D-amino-acid deacylase
MATVSREKRAVLAQAFDPAIESFMKARDVPGGALAVVKKGRLVYARGYGWANREMQIPARPASLFRIASLSKPVTAVAILKLVEEGKLSLDQEAFDLIQLSPVIEEGKQPDPRLARITVRQLLQHTGGWDRDKSFDPMFRPKVIAEKAGTRPPADPESVIRYMLGQPLDFDPGARYAYSNLGYCILGRIIEKVTAQPYEKFVQENVLAPCGVKRMRLGRSLDGQQADGEVRYYMPDDEKGDSVFPDGPRKVPWPYGGFNLEAMDAHGGWIASAADLARFAAALDDPTRSPLLKASTFNAMYAPPPPPASRKADGTLESNYYCCGWMTRLGGNGAVTGHSHSGSLPGTATFLTRRADGVSWVALFNQRSATRRLPDGEIVVALQRVVDSTADWPADDLFSRSEYA